MEQQIMSAAEAAEYGEFKRSRREAEVRLTLGKLVADASRRETDKHALKSACDGARQFASAGVLVSPVNVVSAKRNLAGSRVAVVCRVGGTGESLMAVKKAEAKKAVRQGAKELRLVLCYSALAGGGFGYLKREIKKVKRAAKKRAVVVSLEDRAFGEDAVALGVRAACEGGADGVCVRGETQFVLRAVRVAAGRLRVDAAGAVNAEQLKALLRAGASRVTTDFPARIAGELYRAAEEEARQIRTAPAFRPAPPVLPGEPSGELPAPPRAPENPPLPAPESV